MKKILVSFTYPGDKKGMNLSNFKAFDKVYVIADAVKNDEQKFNCRKGRKISQYTENEIIGLYPQTEFAYYKSVNPNPSGEMKNFGEQYVMERLTDNDAMVYFMDGNKTAASKSSLDLVLNTCAVNKIDIVPSEFSWSAWIKEGKINERYFIDCGWLYIVRPDNFDLFKKYRPLVFNEVAPEAFSSYHDIEHFLCRSCHCSLVNAQTVKMDCNTNSSAPHDKHVQLWNLAIEKDPAHKEIMDKYLYSQEGRIGFHLKRKWYGENMKELIKEVNEKIYNKKEGDFILRNN